LFVCTYCAIIARPPDIGYRIQLYTAEGLSR
jgi:hypothetical protein